MKPKRVAIHSDHPGAFIHRGGHSADASMVTIHQRSRKQSAFLQHEYGVRMPYEGKLEYPARPHATTNPDLENAIAARFEAALRKAGASA
jgi:hypothetical protein